MLYICPLNVKKMGRQIIKQPNGKYCIFSSIVDNVTHYDMSPEEIIETWANEAKQDIETKVKNIITELENDERPYHQFTMSFDDMLETIQDVHGDSELEEVKKLISQ